MSGKSCLSSLERPILNLPYGILIRFRIFQKFIEYFKMDIEVKHQVHFLPGFKGYFSLIYGMHWSWVRVVFDICAVIYSEFSGGKTHIIYQHVSSTNPIHSRITEM